MADEVDIVEKGSPAPAAPAARKPEPPLTPVSDGSNAEGDEYDESQVDSGEGDDGEADEGEAISGLLDGIDDEDDDGGEGAPAKAGKPDPSLSMVPKTADGYVLPKIEGLELSDADKPALQGFMQHAHKIGAPQSAINAGLSFFAELKANLLEMDKATAKNTRAALIDELGADGFKTEAGRIKNALRAMPEGLGTAIQNARLPDGRKLINDPSFFRWMQGQNAKTRVPTQGDRMKEIESVMKKDINEYFATGLSDEYAKLLAERDGHR
jgi:hypothetical protein